MGQSVQVVFSCSQAMHLASSKRLKSSSMEWLQLQSQICLANGTVCNLENDNVRELEIQLTWRSAACPVTFSSSHSASSWISPADLSSQQSQGCTNQHPVAIERVAPARAAYHVRQVSTASIQKNMNILYMEFELCHAVYT